MNMFPEDTAKTKWCPFARVEAYPAEDVSATINRTHIGEPPKATLCIASACMAWQWEGGAPPYGYCGLARRRP